ncbi:MAG: hypothetical protein IKL88_00165 [Erysipelotrichales bacterium]|nr:hypothetical protein [Erysipelotrichales bacterium]
MRKWMIGMLVAILVIISIPKVEAYEIGNQYDYLSNTHTIYFEDVENLVMMDHYWVKIETPEDLEKLDTKIEKIVYSEEDWAKLYSAQMMYLNLLELDENMTKIKNNISAINNEIALNEMKVKLGMAVSTYNSNMASKTTLQTNLKTLEETRITLRETLNELLGYDKRDALVVMPITELKDVKVLTLKKSQSEARRKNFMIDYMPDQEAYADKIDDKVESIHEALEDSLEQYKNSVYATTNGTDKRAIYELQYQLGMISKMNYQYLMNSIKSDVDTSSNVLADVYKNYVEYRCAINGYMPSLLTTSMNNSGESSEESE